MKGYGLYCDTRLGGLEQYSIGEPEDFRLRVPDSLKTCICFLCVRKSAGDDSAYSYGGTGFFVSVPSELSPDLSHGYVLTARHNIEKAQQAGDLFLRINSKDGPVRYVKVSGEWLYPENEAADVAVLKIPDVRGTEATALPLEMFVTDQVIKQRGIGIGDDLFITGLFTQHYGTQRNLPILRTGIIAAMPDEPLRDVNSGLEYKAYLAEVRSIGGLSGSPVFVAPSRGWRQNSRCRPSANGNTGSSSCWD
jgi:hypothetical protein